MAKEIDLETIARQSVRSSLKKVGILPEEKENPKSTKSLEITNSNIVNKAKTTLKEALVFVPRAFLIKTEFLSSKAKQAHEVLYQKYVDAFNKISTMVDASNTEESNSNHALFRSLKIDEQYNLNAIKLHELYFTNISDVKSTIATDSLPYMRLQRDFGTFDKWQFDFRACCMSAREGWAVTYFEPYKNVYMNCVIDSHNINVPVGCIPVLVMDMWSHSYYRDYLDDKMSYINAMMREINWNVVEARMVVAERSRLDEVYKIQPLVNEIPQKMLSHAEGSAPIGNSQIETNAISSDIANWEQPNKMNPSNNGSQGAF